MGKKSTSGAPDIAQHVAPQLGKASTMRYKPKEDEKKNLFGLFAPVSKRSRRLSGDYSEEQADGPTNSEEIDGSKTLNPAHSSQGIAPRVFRRTRAGTNPSKMN